jgi:hypothetical protein
MSAPEGKTDVPREPGHFRLDPNRSLRLVRVSVRKGWKEDGALRLCGLQLTASVVKAS